MNGFVAGSLWALVAWVDVSGFAVAVVLSTTDLIALFWHASGSFLSVFVRLRQCSWQCLAYQVPLMFHASSGLPQARQGAPQIGSSDINATTHGVRTASEAKKAS
jgi:hypothetical protein